MADAAETLFPIDDDDARATGLMPAQYLKALIERREVRAIEPILADQLQPASIDLRLGANAWRVRASFLPGRGAQRAGQDRRARHAPLRAHRRGCGARARLRLHRRADGEPGAAQPHLGDCQPEELDRPHRRLHAPDHRSGDRVRPGARQLPRAAVRRDLAPDLQHPGAQGRPAEPAPDQARHAALAATIRCGACICATAWSTPRSRPTRSGAACRSRSISPARARARSSATGRASTPT